MAKPKPAFYVAVLFVLAGLVTLALWRYGKIGPGRETGQIALHIRQEHRDTNPREVIGQSLQGDRLARARRTGDQPVPVGQRRPKQHILPGRGFRDDKWFAHVGRPSRVISRRANSGPFPSSSCLK